MKEGIDPSDDTRSSAVATDRLAVCSLILGVLCIPSFGVYVGLPEWAVWFAFAGIPAIGTGIAAKHRMRKSPSALRVEGVAEFGVMLGLAGAAFSAFLIFTSVVVGTAGPKKAARIACSLNVQQMSLACAMYAEEHNSVLPESLDQLTPYLPRALNRMKSRQDLTHYLKVRDRIPYQSFICPFAKERSSPSYRIVGAGTIVSITNKSQAMVIAEIWSNHGSDFHVGYLSGRSERVTEEEVPR